jgi:glutamine cyclotransferase
VIDPADGVVTAWIDFAGLRPAAARDPEAVLNGIAFDAAGKRLFVTGKWWPNLFEVRVRPSIDR